jgi:replicative DNA helicase
MNPPSIIDPFDQLPPHSVEAEQAVIGAILQKPADALPEVLTELHSKAQAKLAFYDLRHATIFGVVLDMYEAAQPMDVILIRQRLKDVGLFEAVGGDGYLDVLLGKGLEAFYLAQYTQVVAAKWKLRKMQASLVESLARLRKLEPQDTAESILESISADVLDVVSDARSVAGEPQLMGDWFDGIQTRMESFVQGRKVMLGLPTGFNYLDNMLCGLKGGEYIVIAARPGQGKTSIVLQMAEHVAVRMEKPVAVFSMEMSGESLAERVWFGFSGANFQHYRNGFMEQRDIPRLTTAGVKLRRAPIWVDETCAMNIQRLSLVARKLKRQHGIAAIFVDYLQLMPATPGRENDMRARELADISMGLKRLAKELNLPVVVLAQMNRNIEQEDNKNRKPVLSDLKDCGQIEQDADVVGFLYHADLRKPQMQWEDTGQRPPAFRFLDQFELPEQEQEAMRKAKLVPEWTPLNWKKHLRRINLLIAKQRNGPTGDCALVYESARMRFHDAYNPEAEAEAGAAAPPVNCAVEMPTAEELGWGK